MAAGRKQKPPPKPRKGKKPPTGVKVTKDHRRRAEELIREHGWEHWREKP